MSTYRRITSALPPPALPFEHGSADSLRDAEPIDLFDAWLFAEAECGITLQGWSGAAMEDKAEAHAAYSAALDREEQAARVLRDRLRLGN